MALSCQTIVDRAKAFSALNTPLTADRSEMLSRIRADQRALFAEIADTGCERFQSSASVTSSSGSSARTLDVSALTPPLGRVLTVSVTSTGYLMSQVDVQDPDSKFAPRYVGRGTTLVEVGSDWSATSGTVGCTLVYVQGPTDIDPTGAYTQVISIPDEWADLLVLPLAMYLHQKDPGRDPAEFERLGALHAQRHAAFRHYLTGYAGEVVHAPAHVQRGA